MERINQSDVDTLKVEERFQQIEANSAAALELIESLSDKNQL